jgi:hypothetical protein
MSVEERREADITDIRCLMLCTAVLERVNGVRLYCLVYQRTQPPDGSGL